LGEVDDVFAGFTSTRIAEVQDALTAFHPLHVFELVFHGFNCHFTPRHFLQVLRPSVNWPGLRGFLQPGHSLLFGITIPGLADVSL
jgi:hypothetical protein